MKQLERVQERATELGQGFNSLPYQERLKRLKIIAFELRRLRADLIEVFKIPKGMELIDREILPEIRESNTQDFNISCPNQQLISIQRSTSLVIE